MIIWVMLIGLIFCQSASAESYAPDCAVFINTSTDWTRTQSIEKFDPSLGVLTKVVLTANACASQSFKIDNEDSEGQSYKVTSNAKLTTPMPDGSTLTIDLDLGYREFFLEEDSDPGYGDFEGDDSYSFFEKKCDEIVKEFDDPAALAAWIGVGRLNFVTSTKGTANIDGPGNYDSRIRTFGEEKICVTYYYKTCNDDNACTTDSVVDNKCVHTPITCDDKNACTDDSCNPATGCVYTPITCDDSNPCTADSCNPATGCVYTPITCDDKNACTEDSCDPATGCVYTPIVCDDKDACTEDSCDPVKGCVFTPIVCDDGDPCTTDECVDGKCVFTPIDCDDGDPCTIDRCVDGVCDNTPMVCDDGDPCTTDECVDGKCVFTPMDCDDGDPCTIDRCVDGKCVFTPMVCDDGDPCTTDECVDGKCVFTPIDCDDGDPCTIDRCVDGKCVFTPMVCDDGDPCTSDACVDGVCVHTPITNCNCASKCPWSIRNDLYTASCTEVKEVSAIEGILANDPAAVAVLNPESITIDPKYGTIEVHEDGSFVYDPTGARGLYNGVYVIFKYSATNGYCEAKNQGTAKIQVRCKR